MSSTFLRHQSLAFLFLVGIATLHGSPLAAEDIAVDSKTTVAVSIALDGKPMESGKIFFHLPKDQFAGGQIKAGKCQLDCVPAGNQAVTIVSKGVPKRYSSLEQTVLSVRILPGKNVFAFELSSD